MNNKRILILGSGGFLGYKIQEYSITKKINNICFAFHSKIPSFYSGEHLFADLKDINSIKTLFTKLMPEVVVNLTCLPVSTCETNKSEAFSVQTEGILNLANLCKKSNIRLIQFSTDMVYSGNNNNLYLESDIAHPINVYGETKLSGENSIKNTMNNYIILRSALIMGKPAYNCKRGFLAWMANNIIEKKAFNLFTDQVRTPIIADDLVQIILQLSNSSHSGILNCGGNSIVNRVQMGEWLTDAMGYGKEFISHIKMDSIISSTPMQRDLSMDNSKLKEVIDFELTDLENYIRNYGMEFLK